LNMPLFSAKKIKNCTLAATAAAFNADSPSSPATEPPPKVLKKV